MGGDEGQIAGDLRSTKSSRARARYRHQLQYSPAARAGISRWKRREGAIGPDELPRACPSPCHGTPCRARDRCCLSQGLLGPVHNPSLPSRRGCRGSPHADRRRLRSPSRSAAVDGAPRQSDLRGRFPTDREFLPCLPSGRRALTRSGRILPAHLGWALKLKKMGYINTKGYAVGAPKLGAIALIEAGNQSC